MEDYKKRLAHCLAETGALFFDRDLILKDGRPTPYFVNMAMFKTGRLSLEIGSFFAGMMISMDFAKNVDIIMGPSYKGSSLALATTIGIWLEHKSDILFDYDRKEAKVHGEASASKSMFVNRTLFDRCRIFIVDDVATSMSTKYDLLEKIEIEARAKDMEIHIVGVGIGIDRQQTTAVYDKEGNVVLGKKGVNAIKSFESKTGIPVYSVAGIREIIDYLYQEKVPVMIEGERTPIDDKTMSRLIDYLKTYGVD